MHALCAHAQGFVVLHVESYGVAGPLVETLYRILATKKVCSQESLAREMLLKMRAKSTTVNNSKKQAQAKGKQAGATSY